VSVVNSTQIINWEEMTVNVGWLI